MVDDFIALRGEWLSIAMFYELRGSHEESLLNERKDGEGVDE